MIIDGKIKVKSSGSIKRFTKKSMVFEDGSELEADVVVFASGFGDSRTPMRTIVGEEVGEKLHPIWNLDYEGETRGAWKEIGVENLWCMMGTSLCGLDGLGVDSASQVTLLGAASTRSVLPSVCY